MQFGAAITGDQKSQALDAASIVAAGGQLNEEHLAVLESIVLPNGLRPAYDILHDSFDDLPSVWSDINAARAPLESMIRSIGRLNVVGHPSLSFIGTAFVCGDGWLMTNRHVVELVMSVKPMSLDLVFRPGLSANVDLKQEVASTDSVVLELTGVACISTTWDAGLFKTKSLPPSAAPTPLRASKPPNIVARTAAVIGYPAFDAAENLIQQIQIFRGTFDKKRLEPGKINGYAPIKSFGNTVTALAHDCTTLGGNSGSALIDVAEAQVFGLHFGGLESTNFAVPTWELASDPAFSKVRNQLSFV